MSSADPNRLQRIEHLYHSAREKDPSERETYLANACQGDAELLRAVASLLAQDSSGGDMPRQMPEFAASLFVTGLTPGTQVGPFEILSRIGEGGMGAVYKARDTRLGRSVAIKTAKEDFSGRFRREARAISALNHPHICTLYDIGPNYLVMELVEGETLASLLNKRRLPIDSALSYAAQIADALAAAHRSGIVHRDLKPGNIMLTEDGRIKVLDFGLAKLAHPAPAGEVARTETMRLAASLRTEPGVIVGTLAYMSPEQARGENVDTRSDIFSFGTVLYEMITGHPAFRGNTQLETGAAVLHQDPKPVGEIIPGFPRPLEKIVRHCLHKDPAQRFQHMGDVALLLEDLRDELKAGSPHVMIQPTRRRPSSWLAAIGLALLALYAGAFWRFGRSSPPERGPILKRLTFDEGLTTTPAISADGRLLAFASDRAGLGNLDIWVRQLAGGEPIQITRDPADEYDPAFSPDGTKIAFRSDREGGGIYVTSALGGEDLRMIVPEGHSPRFSPDGSQIAYWVGEGLGTARPMRSKVFIMSASGGERREVAPELAAAFDPVWSPDGKYLLFAGSPTPHTGVAPDWFVVPADGGLPAPIGASDLFRRLELANAVPSAWTRSNQVLFSAQMADSTNIWQVPIQSGKWRILESARRLTFGAGTESNASLVSGSGPVRLVFSVLKHNLDVWSLPLDANRAKPTGELRRLTRDESGDKIPSVTADGTLVAYSSNRSGTASIYIQDLKTGKATRVTSGIDPTISADGSTLVYVGEDRSKNYLLKIGPGDRGKPPIRLKLADGFGMFYDLSSDGNRLFYAVKTNDRWGVNVLNFGSGQDYALFRHPQYEAFHTRPSPDDRWLVLLVMIDDKPRLHIAPFRPGAAVHPGDWFMLTNSAAWEDKPSWSPDGAVVYYTSDRDGFRCIWAQRVNAETKKATGPQIPVYHLHSTRLSIRNLELQKFGMVLARDKLVFNMAEITGNLWVAQLPER